ncbi:hypothetical protein D3878_05405 [Noviherbaspirillum sedimenti]|uniref:Uncharacterized protein n=1 Tax=Noviherbaspirillum sedimenti TaxID=2320865 RepID=A0A3A3G2P1_9BURK|nr:hypothetical protein D3878_05405 [Noviherbaspirillum sedimenti]
MLSVTAAIVAGIIIANNNSFRLKVADGSRGDTVAAHAAISPDATVAAVAARPARPLAAPPAPALSIPKQEHPQPAILQARKVRAPAKQKSMRPGNESRGARHASTKAKATRLAQQAPRAPLVQASTNGTARAESQEKISSVPPRQTRQSLPGLGHQYARCAQLNGLLRRERCKWDVCGEKWGKQGCPSYQYKISPEMGGLSGGWSGQRNLAEDG